MTAEDETFTKPNKNPFKKATPAPHLFILVSVCIYIWANAYLSACEMLVINGDNNTPPLSKK